MAFADQMCGITVEYVSLHLASAPTFSLTVYVVLVPLQKFSSSCNSSVRAFSLHQVLREQTRARETSHYAVQTKLNVKGMEKE